MNNSEYKIVLIGDTGVGKSSILACLINDKAPTQPTVGAAYTTKIIKIDEQEIKLRIWDTAGQERYKSLGPIYYRFSLGCLCVFDITNKSSFVNLKEWITNYKYFDSNENKKIMIVANKCDYNKYHWITDEESIRKFAEENNCDYILTNCVDGENIYEAFYKLAKSIREINTELLSVDIVSNKNQVLNFAEKILSPKIFMPSQC